MYLAFDLPSAGSKDFPTAHIIAYWLHREFDSWEQIHQVPYRTKFHKNKLRLIFSTEAEYYFFMISWKPSFIINGVTLDESWARFAVINPPMH